MLVLQEQPPASCGQESEDKVGLRCSSGGIALGHSLYCLPELFLGTEPKVPLAITYSTALPFGASSFPPLPRCPFLHSVSGIASE